MLKVRDIMTKNVVALAPESTIREAMETLTNNHLSGAPVVAGETVVGVVSMTDIVGFIVGAPAHTTDEDQETRVETWDSTDDDYGEEAEEVQLLSLSEDVWDDWSKTDDPAADTFPERASLLDQRSVEEIMNPEVISISPEDSVKAAATIMRRHGIHRVLVMRGKSLSGIITSLDIARAVSEARSGKKT